MAIIKDIHDLIKDVGQTVTSDNNILVRDNTRGSVASEAKKGILQFPVLCSSALSLEEATMMAKALEREFVSFIRVITSIDSITDERDVKSYLRRMHQNNKPMNIGHVFNENAFVVTKQSFDLPKLDADTHAKAMQLNEEFTKFILEATEEDDSLEVIAADDLDASDEPSIDDLLSEFRAENPERKVYKLQEFTGLVLQEGTKIQQAFLVRNHRTHTDQYILTPPIDTANVSIITPATIIQECTKANFEKLAEYKPWYKESILNEMVKPQNYSVMSENSSLVSRHSKYGKRLSESSSTELDPTSDASNYMNRPATSASSYDVVLKDQLSDNDAKKANEMVPTMLHVKTYFRNELGDMESVDYMIGVKTIVHTVKTESIEQNLVRGVTRGNAIFNFIRWTTGETEFFKDFLFAIDNIKHDVKSKFTDAKWWTVLSRRRKTARALNALNFKNQLLPNSTIVVTMDEVQKLRNDHSVDLMDTHTVRKLMDQYFLLAFVIADTASEMGYFMFDGEGDFQQYSYVSLERENSNQAREVKNIMQILGKM